MFPLPLTAPLTTGFPLFPAFRGASSSLGRPTHLWFPSFSCFPGVLLHQAARLTTGFPLFPAFRGASSFPGPPTHHWFPSFSCFPGCSLFPRLLHSPLVSRFFLLSGVLPLPQAAPLTTGFLLFLSFRGASSSSGRPNHHCFPAFSLFQGCFLFPKPPDSPLLSRFFLLSGVLPLPQAARLTTGFPLFPAFRGAHSSTSCPTHHWFPSFSRFPGCFLFPRTPHSPLVSLFFLSCRGTHSSPSRPTHHWFPSLSCFPGCFLFPRPPDSPLVSLFFLLSGVLPLP